MENKVKILVIRFSSIGDIVLTTPVIRCLKNQLEGNVEVHYLTKSVYKELLVNNPYIHKVHNIEKSTNEVIDILQSEQFDYVVDLHKNLRSSRVKKRLNALSFSFDKLNLQKWLLVNFKINLLPDVHIVDRYLDTVKALGIENDYQGLDYFLPETVRVESIIPDKFQEDYIALVLGANHATKKIPLNKLKELIFKLDRNVVLVGGKADREWGNELEKVQSNRIYNACGKTNLDESACLLKHASYVITPDTGMMHIAAAFQKRTISVWGNTVPEFGMYPYLKKENESNLMIIENEGLSCRPCSKIGFDKCPKGHFKCMEQLKMQEIVNQIDKKG